MSVFYNSHAFVPKLYDVAYRDKQVSSLVILLFDIANPILLNHGCLLQMQSPLFSSPEPKARASYCHSAPSVRPSVVVVRP